MISPGSFASVLVNVFCTLISLGNVTMAFPSPSTLLWFTDTSMSIQKGNSSKLKAAQNTIWGSISGFVLFLPLPLFSPLSPALSLSLPLQEMLLLAKAFPSLTQLPYNLQSSHSQILWIWNDGKAPLHQRFDCPWNRTPAAGHSFIGFIGCAAEYSAFK